MILGFGNGCVLTWKRTSTFKLRARFRENAQSPVCVLHSLTHPSAAAAANHASASISLDKERERKWARVFSRVPLDTLPNTTTPSGKKLARAATLRPA